MRHPRERRLDRRDFLIRGGGTMAGLSSLGALLAACGGTRGEEAAPPASPGAEPVAPPAAEPAPPAAEQTPAEPTPPPEDSPFPLARPDNPVTLPIFDDNPPIDSGLQPEEGPLRIYNYIDYLWKRKTKEFGEAFGVDVDISTFVTMDEAIAKLATGSVEFDVFFATVDRLGKLVAGKVLQPLNLDYVPNLRKNIWPNLVDPYYDRGARYTVPYTVWMDGIGWRTDKVTEDIAALPNPYEIFWQGGYPGKTYLLDDYRDAIGMALLRRGVTDVNTGDPVAIEQAKQDLRELLEVVNIKVSGLDYTNLPEGAAWIHQAWSGSLLAAPWYLPEGTDPSVLAFWYPHGQLGVYGSDTITVLRSAKNPVLAHHFVNFMLDETNAFENFVNYNGYQPPLKTIDPKTLLSDGWFPENLSSAVMLPEDFDAGTELLELAPEADILWQNAWAEFMAGV